jgi:hypothetical protein
MLKFRLVFLFEKEPPTRAKYLFKWMELRAGGLYLKGY